MSQPVVFFCPQMKNLAHAICSIGTRQCSIGKIAWSTFSDGSLDAVIGEGNPGYVSTFVHERDIVFLASFDSPADIQNQMLVIYELARHEAHSFKIVISYFPGTVDREDKEGRVVTAMGYMNQLANIPLQRGPAIVITFDLHVPHELFYLGQHARCRALTAIPLFEYIRKQMMDKSDYHCTIAFPDDGAYKRFAHLISPTMPKILCYKQRFGDNRKVTIVEGDPGEKHVVIMDDLVMTGNTILECRQALIEAGAQKVSVFAPHGVFPQESWKKFLNAGFGTIWITDSCPKSAEAVTGKKPFEVLSLAPLIARAIAPRG